MGLVQSPRGHVLHVVGLFGGEGNTAEGRGGDSESISSLVPIIFFDRAVYQSPEHFRVPRKKARTHQRPVPVPGSSSPSPRQPLPVPMDVPTLHTSCAVQPSGRLLPPSEARTSPACRVWTRPSSLPRSARHVVRPGDTFPSGSWWHLHTRVIPCVSPASVHRASPASSICPRQHRGPAGDGFRRRAKAGTAGGDGRHPRRQRQSWPGRGAGPPPWSTAAGPERGSQSGKGRGLWRRMGPAEDGAGV